MQTSPMTPSMPSLPIDLRLPTGGIADRQRSFLEAMGRHGVGAVRRSTHTLSPTPAPASETAPPDAHNAPDTPATAGVSGAPDPSAHTPDRARRAAEQFVATTFLMPILKEIRAQNRAAPPFGPTEAEKSLGPLMDAQLADRMVRSRQFGIVDRIAADLRQMEQRQPAAT